MPSTAPCEVATCIDPADVDDGGHGTHVAGTIAAARNGLGIAGVAPDATIVNVRGWTGLRLLLPLRDGGRAHLRRRRRTRRREHELLHRPVALQLRVGRRLRLRCTSTAEQLADQAFVRSTVLAAEDYATDRGVTLVAAAGNGHTDYAAPTRFDATSPDYPLGTETDANRHQQLPRPAERGPRRRVGVRGRSEHHQGRLLQLRPRERGGLRPRRLVPRRGRHPHLPDAGQPDPVELPAARRDRGGAGQPGRHPHR